MTPENTPASGVRLLLQAAEFAADRHRTQCRKDVNSTPYINHPLAVAAVLANQGVEDFALLAAALLHDTVEDTETTFADLTAEFGDQVCGLVAEVTDDKSLSKARRKQLQVKKAPSASPAAKQLKLADKICNLTDIDAHSPYGWTLQRKGEYLDWAARVASGCRGVHPALETLFDETLQKARSRLAEEE